MFLENRKRLEYKNIFNVICYFYFIYTLPIVYDLIKKIYYYLITIKTEAKFFKVYNRYLYVIDKPDMYLYHRCPYLNTIKGGIHNVYLYKGEVPLCPGEEFIYYADTLLYSLLVYTWCLLSFFLVYQIYENNQKKKFIYIEEIKKE